VCVCVCEACHHVGFTCQVTMVFHVSSHQTAGHVIFSFLFFLFNIVIGIGYFSKICNFSPFHFTTSHGRHVYIVDDRVGKHQVEDTSKGMA